LVVCLILVAAPAGAQSDAPAQTDPCAYVGDVRFSPEIYLFHGEVEDLSIAHLTSDREQDSDEQSVLRIKILEPVHVPNEETVYQVVPRRLGDDCQAVEMTPQEIIDGYRSGDQVKVAARLDETSQRLIAEPVDGLVLLAGRSASSAIEIRDHYDFRVAIFLLQKRLDDFDRVGVLTRIGRFFEDRQAYSDLLDAQLDQKRLRKRLLGLYDAHHSGR
jgi:hypothetical protein